ncbi:SDR family NAD(P)-dependent oxidoreductase [Flavihumibacter sp. UBA7668]|uniref:SDR family NAD(P)-dependent oxidoreductase n=1 Tax=Flavihumibacter sp. UBA7668 TaxID=1946542 RepID=UPI0025BCE85E|nr:SDR family NAD(P)-dependent oxidoreductase [Flavihumibacter sp. UBA7668]
METKKVWLVTGASRGLGLALVKELLVNGYRVAATTRDLSGFSAIANSSPQHFLPIQMNLLDEHSVQQGIQKMLDTFGRVDVVVNNAGYGQIGTLEELTDQESRRNFDVNVFGSLNIIRKILPQLRKQQSGAIFNIASVGGFTGNFPGWGIYCATKFAVAGFTESLAAEVKSFGITATVVYPGYFRTDFLSDESLNLPAQPILEYKEARALEAAHKEQIQGNQAGDPHKAANALIEIAEGKELPLHLFLGSDAFQMAEAKIAEVQQQLHKFEAISKSTEFSAA